MANIGETAEISKIRVAESDAPGTPASGYGYIYEKVNGKLYFKDNAGTETELTAASGMANPMTEAGDIIVGDVAGAPAALPIDDDGDILTLVAGTPAWVAPGSAVAQISSVIIVIDGGGSTITAGVKLALRFYYACTLNAWAIGDPLESGSIVIDLWKDTQANFPPTDADSITNGHEPTLTTAQAAEDIDLSDWSNVTIDVGDWIIFNVDSATDVTLVTLALKVTKT